MPAKTFEDFLAQTLPPGHTEKPDVIAFARKAYAAGSAQSDALREALRELTGQIPVYAIERARMTWGNTNSRAALEAHANARALLGSDTEAGS